MEAPPIYRLSDDNFHQIFLSLPLRQIIICRCVSKLFNEIVSSPSFLPLISTLPPLHLIAAATATAAAEPYLHVYDPNLNHWLRFSLDFLPFEFLNPIASSLGLLYLRAHSGDKSNQSLIVCNPLTRQFRVLPRLDSAGHGSVLVNSDNTTLMILTDLGVVFSSGSNWSKVTSNLPSKPRTPVLISNSIYALCDVGSPWRSQWKLFTTTVTDFKNWDRIEKHEWGDVFDILKRPRLVPGIGNQILMVGGLKSSFSLTASCSAILILRLDLDSLEWDEAGRMPLHMFQCFNDSSHFKVFGCANRICFSANKMEMLALWNGGSTHDQWQWISRVPGYCHEPYRAFVFDAQFTPLPPLT